MWKSQSLSGQCFLHQAAPKQNQLRHLAWGPKERLLWDHWAQEAEKNAWLVIAEPLPRWDNSPGKCLERRLLMASAWFC